MEIRRKEEGEEGFGVLGMEKTSLLPRSRKSVGYEEVIKDVQKRIKTLGEVEKQHAAREITGTSKSKFNMLENI